MKKNKKLMIIAAPKTASTSLLNDLINISGLDGEQTFSSHFNYDLINHIDRFYIKFSNFLHKKLGGTTLKFNISNLRQDHPTEEYFCLSLFHSDICDLKNIRDVNIVFKHSIHKQHLPPTRLNIEKISEDFNLILLINEPQKIINSYKRVPSLKYKKYLSNRFIVDRLITELNSFIDNWSKVIPEENIFYKDELINEPHKCLNRCLKLLDKENLQVASDYQLTKTRYYR